MFGFVGYWDFGPCFAVFGYLLVSVFYSVLRFSYVLESFNFLFGFAYLGISVRHIAILENMLIEIKNSDLKQKKIIKNKLKVRNH